MPLLFCEVSIFDPYSFAPLTPPLILLIHPCFRFFTSLSLNPSTPTPRLEDKGPVTLSGSPLGRTEEWLIRAERVKIVNALRHATVSCGMER